MAQNKILRIDPVALAAGTYITNIAFPSSAGGAGAVGYTAPASYLVLRVVNIVNTTAGALTFRLHKTTIGGAAVAANSVIGWDTSIAAGATFIWQGILLLNGSVAADYLVGGGSGAGLTFSAMGEVGLL